MTTKHTLRQSLKAQRRALPRAVRTAAARAVAHLIAGTRWFAPGKRIGLYASLPQELDTAPLIALAQERGCEIFLPRIVSLRRRTMEFVPFDTPGRPHAFGMHEPVSTEFFPARFLDTLFVPSVGLDLRGARLGHGAGFYDRALAFRRVRTRWRGPRLVGLAYFFQVVPRIPVDATDVSMDVVVTEKGIHELLADED